MATGSLDSNGIWQYGEDDSNATFSALLNRLSTSTSDTVTRLENETAAIAPGTTGHPYREASGSVTVTSSGVGGTATVTFPASRFSVAPLVQVSKNGGGLAKYIPYVTGTTSSATTVGIYSGDGTSGSGNVAVAWHAIQMTSSAAAG